METRYIDWERAFNGDEWECLGRQIMEEKRGCWSEENPEGIEGDDYIPIYNFAYPLDLSTLDEGKIVRICEETNCTVVHNHEEDALYLALCGCGMDFTQDIALAYMIAYSYDGQEFGRIPRHMLFDVYNTGALSVSEEQFEHIKNKLIDGFQRLRQSCEQELENLKA